jgi:hypothetical protein
MIGAEMKDRKLLGTINLCALIINVAGGIVGTVTLMQVLDNLLWFFAGLAFVLVAFIYKLVIDIWINNGDNLASILEILDNKK